MLSGQDTNWVHIFIFRIISNRIFFVTSLCYRSTPCWQKTVPAVGGLVLLVLWPLSVLSVLSIMELKRCDYFRLIVCFVCSESLCCSTGVKISLKLIAFYFFWLYSAVASFKKYIVGWQNNYHCTNYVHILTVKKQSQWSKTDNDGFKRR